MNKLPPRFGDIFGYMRKKIEGRKVTPVVVMGVTDDSVIYTDSIIYRHWMNMEKTFFRCPLHRVPRKDFVKWFPFLLGNITCLAKCTQPAKFELVLRDFRDKKKRGKHQGCPTDS